MERSRGFKVLIFTVIAGLILAGCGATKPTEPAKTEPAPAPQAPAFKDTLVIGSQYGDPQGSWDPIDTFLLAWGEVASNIYNGLTYRGPDLKLVPGLATEWKWVDDKTLEFKLRQGVKFHNGEPFNADAVVFTFTRLLGPEGEKSPQRSNYTSIDKVTKVDDATVRFLMKETDPVILTKLAGYGAMIVPPGYIKEKGDATFNTAPVGTGPYKVTSYQKDQQVVLEANPDYWGEKAKTKKVIIRFIPEDATRVAEFQSGAIDIMQTVPVAQVKTLQADKNVKVFPVGGPTAWSVRFDISKPPMEKLEVRQAIASYLKDVGLEVVLNPVDPQQLSGTLITESKAGHMHIFGWGGWTLDFDNTAYLLYSKGQKWDPHFSDAKVNELLTRERSTKDQAVRAAAFKDLTVRLRETMPDVPLYQAVAVWATSAKVAGFVAPPDDRLNLIPITVTK